MAYDEELARRIRACFSGVEHADEKRMFGGLCFLVGGNMACGVTNAGLLMVRVGHDAYERTLEEPYARPMDFTGKPLRGLVYVEPEGFASEADLRRWVDRGITFARTLPAK